MGYSLSPVEEKKVAHNDQLASLAPVWVKKSPFLFLHSIPAVYRPIMSDVSGKLGQLASCDRAWIQKATGRPPISVESQSLRHVFVLFFSFGTGILVLTGRHGQCRHPGPLRAFTA